MTMARRVGAILFDLDDTLLENNMDRFLKGYFGLLAPYMAQFVPPDKFMPALLASTRVMVENADSTVTNQQAFIADFFPRVGRKMEEMMPAFDDFYATQFGQLRSLTRARPEARGVVQSAFDVGLDVVIATNPLFPEAAIRQRIEWAGVADFPFKLVTSYEVVHTCKPYPRYYAEIVERIGRKPDECVMVGDDWDNDIAPSMQAGLHAYWLNLEAPLPEGFSPRMRGTLASFGRWLSDGKLDPLWADA
jgi:HAD superfamily hydrolase (TIGR01549 family)